MVNKLSKSRFLTTAVFSLICLISACTSAQVNTSMSNVWIREAPPMTRVNAGYFDITNNASNPINLNSVSSPNFSRIEIHRSVVTNGVAKMVKQDTIEIPGGETFNFKPGGYHIMLFDAKDPYKSGDTVNLTFHFSDGSLIETTAEVRALTNQEEMSGHKHH